MLVNSFFVLLGQEPGKERSQSRLGSCLCGAYSIERKVGIKDCTYKRKLQEGNKRLIRAIKRDLMNYSKHEALSVKEKLPQEEMFQMQSEKLVRVGW